LQTSNGKKRASFITFLFSLLQRLNYFEIKLSPLCLKTLNTKLSKVTSADSH